jgi:hypothetical protein
VEARIILTRRLASLALVALLGTGCDRGSGDSDQPANGANAMNVDTPKAVEAIAGVTPMAQRVAVLGLLNKRNGIVRDITLKPGQAIRFRDAVVRLRACDATAPWENERLTGAFVQLDVEQPGGGWKRVFSGWLYKESPSLNVVEHPVYDVWPKSCAISWPAGPAAPAPAMPSASSNRSSAPKSAGGATASQAGPAPAAPVPEAPAPAPAPPEPSAEPSNAT